jgi:large subunit ribosomal protein L29
MKASEYREKTIEEIRELERDLRQDIFNLRFQHATGQLDDVSKLRQAKHNLARVKTLLREHEMGVRTLLSAEEQRPEGA